ncbi:GntR family transcriptional regulator [Sphaerisporangium viridialbum]|uniref:GntR family transcriptional regulator n=1 Tax=Sphaerisporangium viridialbum TaxID=46189 RepID=UPI003C70A1BC
MSSDTLGPMNAASLADQAYERLREAVRDGTLRPGEKITERDLAARLGVSPTPVREALRQLVHEKVVERVGSRALRVSHHSPDVLSEIAEAEARLSGLMAGLAARKASDRLIGELREILDRTDRLVEVIEQAAAEHDPAAWPEDQITTVFRQLRRFHHLIESAAGNPVLSGLLQQTRAFSDEERYDLTVRLLRERAPDFRRRYRQHHELLAAIADRDAERAEAVALHHHRAALRQLADG